MNHVFVLLLAVLCYAQFVATGDRRADKGRGRGKLRRLEKEISDLKDEVSCLTNDMKECKNEIEELNSKLPKFVVMLIQSK